MSIGNKKNGGEGKSKALLGLVVDLQRKFFVQQKSSTFSSNETDSMILNLTLRAYHVVSLFRLDLKKRKYFKSLKTNQETKQRKTKKQQKGMLTFNSFCCATAMKDQSEEKKIKFFLSYSHIIHYSSLITCNNKEREDL